MCQLGQMDQLSYIHIHSLKQVADNGMQWILTGLMKYP